MVALFRVTSFTAPAEVFRQWWLESRWASTYNRQYLYGVGVAFEKLAVETLRPLGFQLYHCGRTGDQGVDFHGFWVLPDKKVPIVGQCKFSSSSTKSLSKQSLWQMESAVKNYETGQAYRKLPGNCGGDGSERDVIGMMVVSKGFKQAYVNHFNSSDQPLILAQIIIGANKAGEDGSSLAEHISEACWGAAGKPVRRVSLLQTKTTETVGERTHDQQKTVWDDSDAEVRRIHLDDPLKLSDGGRGLRGYVTGFLMNKKAQAVAGDVTVGWLHDTSCRDQHVKLSDLIMFYNGTKITSLPE